MPDRLARNRAFAFIVIGLLVCILGLGLYGILSTRALNDALGALKTSSARGECRTQVVNDDEDFFRHAIGDVLAAAARNDDAAVAKGVEAIRTREPTQVRIDRQCPAPLVQSKPTKEAP